MNSSVKMKADTYLERMKIVLNHIATQDSTSKTKQTLFLKNLLPEGDQIFTEYAHIFEGLQTPKIRAISYVTEQHYRIFRNETKPSLEELISKTIEHYHKSLDELTQRSVNIEISFHKVLENFNFFYKFIEEFFWW